MSAHPIHSISVVGSGNVAEAIALAVAESEELHLKQIVARNPERGRVLAEMTGAEWCQDAGAAAEADLYIICVSDRAVGDVAATLPSIDSAIVVHTAGSVEMDVLGKRARGVFYPFQTFTKGRRVDFSRVPLFVEGYDEPTACAIENFARELSHKVYRAGSQRRREIHLTGVLACNFVNGLYAMAADRLQQREGLSFEVLQELVLETARKATEATHPRMVQTGPAVRGDKEVATRHMAMLEDETQKEIYKLLNDYIWQTSKKI